MLRGEAPSGHCLCLLEEGKCSITLPLAQIQLAEIPAEADRIRIAPTRESFGERNGAEMATLRLSVTVHLLVEQAKVVLYDRSSENARRLQVTAHL